MKGDAVNEINNRIREDTPILALEVANLIVAREFNTAEANRELALGGWSSDHSYADRMYNLEIVALIEKMKKCRE